MQRLLFIAALACMLVTALLPVQDAAASGASAEFRLANVRWTLPERRWKFEPVTYEQSLNGYFTKVSHTRYQIDVFGGTLLARGRDLELIAQEILKVAKADMSPLDKSGVEEGAFLKTKGVYVWARGKIGGVPVYVSIDCGLINGVFYFLYARCWRGAEEQQRGQLLDLLDGYQLIRRAEPVEKGGKAKPKKKPRKPATKKVAAGPVKRDGNLFTFPTHNLQFNWHQGDALTEVTPPADGGADGTLLTLASRKSSDELSCSHEFGIKVMTRPADLSPLDYAKDKDWQIEISKRYFDRKPRAKVKVKGRVPFGNWHAISVHMRGKKDGGPRSVELWITALKESQYVVHGICTARPGGSLAGDGAYEKQIEGIQFLDTKEQIAGPLAGAVSSHATWEGDLKDEPLEIRSMGATVTKPVNMTTFEPQGDLLCAFESRVDGADGPAFFYFDAFSASKGKGTPDILIKQIKRRAAEWLEKAGPKARVSKRKGKKPEYKDKWGRAKGYGWRFKGRFQGADYVEQGWVAIWKQRMYLIRVQFGGTDAEKVFKKTFSKLKKDWKFDK